MAKLRTLLILTLTISLCGMADAAQLVVISSTAPNLKVGAIVDGAKTIELPPGSTVTLVSSEGRTIKLKGPYKGQPDSSPSTSSNDLLQSLSRLVAGPPENDPSLAVFRAAPGSTRQNAWSIDVSRSGVYCLRTNTPLTLWRANASKQTLLTLKQVGGKQNTISRQWPQEKQTMVWPAALPVVDGATFLARLEGSYKWVRLQILLLPSELPTEAHHAAWMAENGCMRQARRLIEAIVNAK